MLKHLRISRRITQSVVVQAIASYGPISRASVAKITGLSKQTVSEIVANLETKNWVQTVGTTEGHIGRRAVMYEIAPEAATVACVDLGGNRIRVALCNLAGEIILEKTEPRLGDDGIGLVNQIAASIRHAIDEARIILTDLHVAVIGVPGVPDPETGKVLMAPNIPGVDKIDFSGELAKKLDIEVLIENDVNLAALGEFWFAKDDDRNNLVFLSIGTGIGAGIIVDGNLLRGNNASAGEAGFLPFGADPFEAESLSDGALERRASARAIIREYAERAGISRTVPAIFELAESGDVHANKTLDSVSIHIARAVAAIVSLIDPSEIVIGGSVGQYGKLCERIKHQVSRCSPRRVSIVKSKLGGYAVMAGATWVALTHLHHTLFAGGQEGLKFSVPAPAIDIFRERAS